MNLFQVIVEEDSPLLGRRLSIPREILAHARFAYVDAELQQLAVMRGAPQPRFSLLMRRMRSRISRGTCGRPGLPLRIFHVPQRRNGIAMPSNDSSGFTMISDKRQCAHMRDSQTTGASRLRATSVASLRSVEER